MTKTKKKQIQSPPTEGEQMKNSKQAVKEETSIEKNITISKNRSKPKENKQNQNQNTDETNELMTGKQKQIKKNGQIFSNNEEKVFFEYKKPTQSI